MRRPLRWPNKWFDVGDSSIWQLSRSLPCRVSMKKRKIKEE
ncbi:hypothetical protein D8I24_0551 (plasmid) [Cupriavidus necator H850]|jgi:hypothetical protein|nr:hypothetical protein D8I24_0551 [Cupriavidus necator H850]